MSNLLRTIKGVEYIRRDEYSRLLQKVDVLEAGGNKYYLVETTTYDTRGEDPDTGGQTVLTYKNKFIMKFRPSDTKNVEEAYMNSRDDNTEFRDGWNGKGWYIAWDRQIDINVEAELSREEYNILKDHLKVWEW
tara:strand:+ start:844 stop:1245 length:402 start_codon:yes stop_codon:yes gene_type:complete